MSAQQASSPPPSGPAPRPQSSLARRGRGLGLRLLLALVLMLCLVLGSLAWLLGTRSGLEAAIALGTRATDGALQVEGAQGRLLGPLRADRVRYHDAELRLELEAVELLWQPEALLEPRLLIERLAVARIDFAQRPTDEPAAPLVLPDRLELPLALEVSELEVGRFTLHPWAPEPLLPSAAESGSAALADASAGAAVIADIAARPDEAAGVAEGSADAAEQMVERAAAEVFWFSDLRAAFDSDGRSHSLRELGLSVAQGRASVEARVEGITPFALAASGRFDGELEGRPLEARFTASETVLNPHIDAHAFSDGLEAHAVLDVAPFADQPLRALKLEAGEVDPAAFVEGLPTAALSIEAELAAAADGSNVLAGPFRILNQKPAAVDEGGLPVLAFSGRLDWRTDSIGVHELDIRLPGDGRIGGQLAWRPPLPAAEGAIDAAVEAKGAEAVAGSDIGQLVAALELVGIDTHALDKRLPRQSLGGRIDAEADAQRQQAVLALKLGAARVDARVELMTDGPAQPGTAVGTEPGPDAVASKGAEAAQAPIAGEPGGAATRRLSVHARLRNVDPRALLPAAPQASLNLDVDASGELPATGLPSALELDFRIPDSRIEGLALAGEGRVRLEGERLPALKLALQLAGNTLSAEGAWGARGDVLHLALDAPHLAALGHELGGRAGASGQLSGTLDAPTGELQFFGEALRLPGSVRVLGLNGVARLDAGADGPFQLAVGLSGLGPMGKDADGVALPDWLVSARVSASGTRARHEVVLDLLTPARDELADSLSLRLQGGLLDGSAQVSARNTGPRWLGEVLALETAGRVGARLQAPARLALSPSAVSLGVAEIVVEEQGRVQLQETTWSPQRSVVRGSLTGLGLAAGSGRERPANAQARRAPDQLMLGAEWDISVGETLDGQLRVFRESGDLTLEGEIRTRLGLEALEAVVNARGDRLTLTVDARGSEFGRVHANASVRARRGVGGMWSLPADSALLGAATLDMPSITWLGRLLRENVETAGSLHGRVSLGGTLEAPLASGQLTGEALQVALVDQGLILSGGEFRVSFDHDRVRLERLAFVSPNRVRPREARIPFDSLTATPGQLTASGEVWLDSGAGDFSFRAERLPLLQREDRWMILSGEGSARSTWSSLALNADFRADAGYIEFAETLAPSLSDDVVVLGREQAPGGAFAVSADVSVSLGDALYLSAMGLETRLAGELKLRLRPEHPLSAVGTIATVGGSYRGYGQSLSIERGVVNFQGSLDAPGLNIVALRKGLPVEAGVSVSGSAKRPQVRLVSEPKVPDPEKLSWIVLGRAPDAGAGADLGLLLPAAQALLGGPGGGMTDELSRSLGFDSFSIGQGELNSSSRSASSRVVGGGSTISNGPSVSSQVLSVGKRLDTDLFLSFEQSLGGAETLVKLSYQLSRRLSLIARGGTDNALDLQYSFSWR